jgi:hypothetical protein
LIKRSLNCCHKFWFQNKVWWFNPESNEWKLKFVVMKTCLEVAVVDVLQDCSPSMLTETHGEETEMAALDQQDELNLKSCQSIQTPLPLWTYDFPLQSCQYWTWGGNILGGHIQKVRGKYVGGE